MNDKDKEQLQAIKRHIREMREIYGDVKVIPYPTAWIDYLIEQVEKVEQLQQENEMFKAALDESAKASATMQKKIGRYAKVIEEILYHYPTPIDEELDYEKAYNEVKEIAKRAWEGTE
ncbi:hypothetical protein ACNR9V_03170 [Parageobacillus thermoglucosidasius]|uniref:hypothetical protein n=1 Tax=Parageobacillus thermoglucosidasius TaxID=1426 RepID=UPI003B66B5D2